MSPCALRWTTAINIWSLNVPELLIANGVAAVGEVPIRVVAERMALAHHAA